MGSMLIWMDLRNTRTLDDGYVYEVTIHMILGIIYYIHVIQSIMYLIYSYLSCYLANLALAPL
jgi:hypothetical protein